jgi:S1-C subfamily serine protease
MSKRWYVREKPDLRPIGPFSVPELREQVKGGQWREALIAADGDAEWRPLLATLAELDPVGAAPTAVHAALTPVYTRQSVPSVHPSSRPPPAHASVPPPPQASVPPPHASVPPFSALPPRPRLSNAGLLVLALVGAIVAGLVVFSIATVLRTGVGKGGTSGIVRVVMPSGSGTGFFVAGPDDLAYVATAYHVVSSGEPILIEQTLGGAGGRQYPTAYPDAEIVAFDADADLAIIRLNGVSRDQFPVLPLASEAKADESVLSYGFPGSNLAHKFGMVSKPGKVLSLVKFPVVDHRTGEVVRSDAIAGLLVSVDIEPGFSGGPTCDDHGDVVGVNVTKDLAHRGQNGAVDVSVLKELLTHVARADAAKDPTPDDVKALLSRIEREYLLLPIDKRRTTREDDFVSTNDLPRVDALITTIRRMENDTSKRPDSKLSGAAALGLVLARLPGKPLETYSDRSTRKAMADCEVREKGLREFFGSIAATRGGAGSTPAEDARAKCSELAFRPLVWDLTSLALQWSGQPRDITVSKVDVVDADRHVYRSAVRFAGVEHLVDVWLATDGGRLRLKLFDGEGEASGMSVARDVPASAFAGTWHRSDPRIAHNIAPGVESDVDTDETLAVAMTGDGAAAITHQYSRHVYMTGHRRLACGGTTLALGLEQSFHGTLESGTITATRTKEAKPRGADMARCGEALGYAPDLVVVLKMVGDKLLVYRTGGVEYPEVAEFTRQL